MIRDDDGNRGVSTLTGLVLENRGIRSGNRQANCMGEEGEDQMSCDLQIQGKGKGKERKRG